MGPHAWGCPHGPLSAGSLAVWSRARMPALQDAEQCAAFEKVPYTPPPSATAFEEVPHTPSPPRLPGQPWGSQVGGTEWSSWRSWLSRVGVDVL